jgi:hypothetical protein
MMKKTRLFMFVAALGLLSALLVVPVKGWAMAISAGASAATAGPHLSGEITISAHDTIQYLPSVAYNWKHREYLVVWHDKWPIQTRSIEAARVSEQGKVLSEFTVYWSDKYDSAQPSVAYDPVNDRYLVVFIQDVSKNDTDWDLYGRFIPWNGPSASLAAFPIITWTTNQMNPKVVYAGGIQKEFLVVWSNTYTGSSPPAYVSVKRIRPDGTFPSVGADLTLSDVSVNYINPDVSYNLARNEYLVVWDYKVSGTHDIWGVRITGNAVPLGGGPFAIAGWPGIEENPSVAACNIADQYLVTWQSDVDSGGTTYDIYGYFVTGAGALQPPPILIVHSSGADIEASVACSRSGDQYLVVYQQLYTNVRYGIWGIPISPDHSMDAGFAIVSPGSVTNRTMPAIAGGLTSYMVVWEHQRDGTSYQDIHGRLITPYMVFLPLVRK